MSYRIGSAMLEYHATGLSRADRVVVPYRKHEELHEGISFTPDPQVSAIMSPLVQRDISLGYVVFFLCPSCNRR